MKSLKTLLTAAVLGLAVLPALSYAQPPAGGGGPGGPGGPGGGGRRGGMTPEQQVQALTDAGITLTAEQKSKITAIYTKANDEMQKLAPEDRRGKGQEMRDATRKEVRAVLTPEQQAKFDAMPQRGGGRGPGGPGGGGAGGPPKQ